VLKNLKKAGIATYVYLIFGTPAENEASARKTLEFTITHRDSIDFLNLAIFNMPVCGATAPGIETAGFYEGDLSLYTNFTHPQGWDRRRVRLFLDSEFRRHPVISSILNNDLPFFTSNHAPFFAMGKSGCQ
ncbi:MAG: radical SAM protein, partial [Dissulfurispiraceae bacterium]